MGNEKACKLKNTTTTVKQIACRIILLFIWKNGAFHKIDDTMKKEKYVNKSKQHLKTSVGKLGNKWIFQMINGTKDTSKIVVKWLEYQQSQGIGVASQSSDLSLIENGGKTEKACVNKLAYKPNSVTTVISRKMGQNSISLLVEN